MISGMRHVARRQGPSPGHPLTADLAGVLAAAQQERATVAQPWRAAPWGIGAVALRFVKGLVGGAFMRHAQRTEGAAPARRSRISV
jgi:hypothetical protein